MKLFTPEEANAALAVVGPLAERLAAAARALAASHGGGNGAGGASAASAAEAIAELDELGVQVKDAGIGLLDFPARHPDGEIVLLCWRLGEDEVAWWHDLESGFAGRRPLPF